jgi:glycosyltransferase involved in cell wall biosynthesis
MNEKVPSDIAALLDRVNRLEKEQAVLRGRQTTLESLVRRRVSTSLREAFRPQLWNFWQYAPRLFQLPGHYSTIKPPENAPRIAIVTPHFDQLQFLKATIDSVVSQNYPNLSYCVQDCDSGEETRRLLESYGEKLVWRSEPDSGQAQAINRGFRHASGDIMAYLNSDDLLLPGTLAYVARAFQDHPEIDLVYGHTIYIESRGWEIGRAVLPPHDPQMLKWMDYIPQETLFWRKRVWDAIGPIDESFRFAIDWDFILRAQTAGFHFMRLPRFLACFRVHEAQKSLSMIDIGNQEMNRIRERVHGRLPKPKEVDRAGRAYLRRQALFHRLYKIGLLHY